MKQRQDTIPALLDRIYLNEALQRLVQFYKVTGNPDQAAEWSKKLAELEADKK